MVDAGAADVAAGVAKGPVFLVTDRPTQGVSPIVVPKGSFQVEAGYKYSRLELDNADVDQHAAPDLLLRYGAGERFELRLFSTGWVTTEVDTESSTETETEFSDITVGAKIELVPQRGRVSKLSLLTDVSFPTSSGSSGNDYVIPKVLLIGGYELSDRYSLTYNIGPSLVTFKEDDERETRWDLNYALAFAALTRPSINLFAELYGNVREGSLPETHNAQVGITVRVAPKLQLDARLGAGLNSAAPDWIAGAGLAFQFP